MKKISKWGKNAYLRTTLMITDQPILQSPDRHKEFHILLGRPSGFSPPSCNSPSCRLVKAGLFVATQFSIKCSPQGFLCPSTQRYILGCLANFLCSLNVCFLVLPQSVNTILIERHGSGSYESIYDCFHVWPCMFLMVWSPDVAASESKMAQSFG